MAHSSDITTINFLVSRKFPAPNSVGSNGHRQSRSDLKPQEFGWFLEATNYRDELEKLPSAELHSLYEAEQTKLAAELQREEELRFYNQPGAVADFAHWSKAEHWTLEEAIALAMGKAPEIVSWSRIESYASQSPFVQGYGRLRDLAQRATKWQKLFDPVLPTIFLKWAEDNEIVIPAELSEKVERLKGKLIDWKKNYDELRAMHDQHIEDWGNLAQQQTNLIEAKQKRIVELESKLAEAEKVAPVSDLTKSQSSLERQNMLKVIYTMAVRGYSFNPTDKRSKVVPEIVSDLGLEGLSLSEDTVRRYLKEARDQLAEWQENSR